MVTSHVNVARNSRRFSRTESLPWRWALARFAGNALLRHWKLLLIAALAGAFVGEIFVKRTVSQTARVTLIRNTGRDSETYSLATILDLLRSPDLLRETTQRANPPVTSEFLAQHSRAEPVPQSELIYLTVTGTDRAQNRTLAELYAKAAVERLRVLRRDEVQTALNAIEARIAKVQEDLNTANQKLASFQSTTGIYDLDLGTAALVKQEADLEAKQQETRLQLASIERQLQSVQSALADHHPALLAARQTLDRALLRYTEEHPKIQELRANVGSIRARLLVETNQVDPEVALSSSSLSKDLYAQLIDLRARRANLSTQLQELAALQTEATVRISTLPGKRLEYATLTSTYESLKRSFTELTHQRQQLDAGARAALSPFRIHQWAHTPSDGFHWLYTFGGGVVGFVSAGGFASLTRACRRRIRSEADLEHATRLPIFASLGDMNSMSERDRQDWAFNTFTFLKGALMNPSTQTLVCGFISSRHGEGRSTCIHLLAEAAAKQGYRTRVVSTNRANETGRPTPGELPVPSDLPDVLASACPAPRVEIPLPGWVWNKEFREQWQHAIQQIGTVSNLVTFIELPPACEPEGILLAEKFSPLIWIGARDHANIHETRTRMEMLRCAGSQVAGAMFNHSTQRAPKRWLSRLVATFALTIGSLQAQQPPEGNRPPIVQQQSITTFTNSFSVVSPTSMAPWQQRLTLGPSDILNISLYEQPDTTRNGISIGPDGTINYLQARDVLATGLTVDELREKLEAVLLKFYRPPLRVIVLPQAYRSKRYYLLGNVMGKGVYALDRPTTVLEAIARAKGFAQAEQSRPAVPSLQPLQSRPGVIQADFSHSFLVRRDETGAFRQVDVDFESLFVRADLNQNVSLAPDDYLYFPPPDLQEAYVLGEVIRPGPVQVTPDLSVLKAVLLRGGYTPRSYRTRVLVVRGSLQAPQTFVIDSAEVLSARAADLRLQPRDIVFVSRKPWYRAEELVKAAVYSFLSSAIISAAGQNIGPFINEPFFE